MKETKNLAELCALLVNDIYGELAARTFTTLMEKGRSSVSEICYYSALPSTHVRHALCVLAQQNLLYHHTNANKRLVTYYEANPEAAYNLIRIGKVVELVAQVYGNDAAELVQILGSLGSARLLDLEEAYVSRHRASNKQSKINGKANGNTLSCDNGLDEEAADHDTPGDIADKLSSSILELLEEDILQICSSRSFENPKDARENIEKEILRLHFNGTTPKGAKGQDQFTGYVREKLLELRNGPQVLKSNLMKKLQTARANSFGNKKRKLENGSGSKGHVSCADVDPNATVRINYEKIAVLLRNRALIKFASDTFGRTTGEVYGVALSIIGRHIPRCRPDPLLDLTFADRYGHEQSRALKDVAMPPVTTLEVVTELPKELDLSIGIGKSKGNINTRRAEKVRPDPPQSKLPFIDEEDESSDDEEDEVDDDDDEGYKEDGNGDFMMKDESYGARENGVNGHAKVVKFVPQSMGDATNGDDDPRLEQTRQHLLLLAESSQGFIRHRGLHEGGEWVVDYKHLIAKLQRFEVDSFIEDKFTRQGLRLINILREKGKLDDKALASIAQTRKPDALQLMTRMETYGIADIQEVPRDNNRQAQRTLFLWFYEDEHAYEQILDNSYKSMLRCRQVLEALRHKNKEIIELFERSDVKGREEERLHKQTIAKYRQHLKTAGNLLNQIMRVDDMVCLLRDY